MRKGTGTNLPDDNRLREDSSKPEVKYTQREWDRTVGWGKVPDEYSHTTDLSLTDLSELLKKYKKNKEIQEEWALNDPRWDERWIPKEKEDET